MRRLTLLILGVMLGAYAFGADLPKPDPTPGRLMLPQEEQYQRVLRAYMATLTEQDFEHGITEKLTVAPADPDPEYQYRTFVMTMMHQPLVGYKRGVPAVAAAAKNFLLTSIEGPEQPPVPPATVPRGIMVPPTWPEALVAFAEWDYPGNLYFNNRALKMRAFVTAAVRMMMLDDHLGKTPTLWRADWNGYQLVVFGRTFMGVKDLLPPEVRQAYQTALLRLGRKILAWGIKGEEPNLDMTAPLGLWYAAQAVNDPEFSQQVEAHARRQMTDPRYFHPAGYWVERGGLDVGFGGMANFFAAWLALASDWPFAKDAVARIYRLRAHLILPEPDGTASGPSHFNSRIGSPACDDEWQFAREQAAFMVTDEAACAITRPTPEMLTGAARNRVAWFNEQITQSQKLFVNGRYKEPCGHLWSWRILDSGSHPATINPGYAHYRKGAYAHLAELEKADSPLLKSPYLRDETFMRNFDNAFVVAKQQGYAAILHTGPVSEQHPDDGLVQYPGPLGFGGGQLSAFWTPATGAVLLGRRIGMSVHINMDVPEQWRQWPLHAIAGCTADGKIFTSARMLQPAVNAELKENGGTVTVNGALSPVFAAAGPALTGRIEYRRVFRVDANRLRVETTVTGDGKDAVAELYETLPVFLRDASKQAKATPTVIEFQVGGQWTPATAEFQQVKAVRLTRFNGAVQIVFEKPQRVKLSPEEWKDTYITRALCRNVLIDLLGGGFPGERTVSYTIAAAAK